MKSQLLHTTESYRVEEEHYKSTIKEQENRIAELSSSLESSQKQLEDYVGLNTAM